MFTRLIALCLALSGISYQWTGTWPFPTLTPPGYRDRPYTSPRWGRNTIPPEYRTYSPPGNKEDEYYQPPTPETFKEATYPPAPTALPEPEPEPYQPFEPDQDAWVVYDPSQDGSTSNDPDGSTSPNGSTNEENPSLPHTGN